MFYYQFWTVLIEAVLIAVFKDNTVTVARGKKEEEKRGKEKCPRHMYLLAQLEEPTNNFLNSLTKNSWGFIYWSKQLADDKGSQTKKRRPVLSASKNTSNIASDSVCLWSPFSLVFKKVIHRLYDDDASFRFQKTLLLSGAKLSLRG